MDKTAWKVGCERRLPVLRKRNLGYEIIGHRQGTVIYVSVHFVVLDFGRYKEAFHWNDLQKWVNRYGWWY